MATSAGVLAVTALAGAAVAVMSEDEEPTPESSPSTAMEYRRAGPEVSRDIDRPSLTKLKAQSMRDYSYGASRDGERVVVESEELATDDPRDIALAMLSQYGWDSSQFGCLDELWIGESQWDPYAENPYSGAYGIPQALPADKMAAAGPDWETNPATQIEWGLGYIKDRYGTPCEANEFKLANGWY